MTENIHESLSALMDDEVGDSELEEILSHIGQNPELRDKWFRLNRARELLHGISSSQISVDLSDRIRHSLEKEPVPNTKSNIPGPDIESANSFISFALAASVMAIVVFGGEILLDGDNDSDNSYAGGISPVSMTPIAGSTPMRASFRSDRLGELSPISNFGNQRVAYDQLRIHGLKHGDYITHHTALRALSYVRIPIDQD